tara:strand:- start:135 stop:839 length:705 start_codon:yes stop_codon:yes gene_type:complete
MKHEVIAHNQKFLGLDLTFGDLQLSKKARKLYVQEIEKQCKENPIDPSAMTAWTGDVNKNYEIHNNKVFSELFKKIPDVLKLHCKTVGVNYNKLNFYVARSWGTISGPDQSIAPHTHSYCNLSMVYYPKVPDDAGILLLQPTNYEHINEFIPNLFDINPESNVLDYNSANNNKNISIKPANDMFVIFPAKIPHHAEPGKNTSPRYSIAIDIVATLKQTNSVEHCLPPLTQWSKV